MTSEGLVVDWEDILDKFSSYKGTIKDFCEEQNISIHQLYYRRKRLMKNSNTVFHAVKLKEKEDKKGACLQAIPPKDSSSSNIKIELGKAKIYVNGDDKESLSNILKVIIESC